MEDDDDEGETNTIMCLAAKLEGCNVKERSFAFLTLFCIQIFLLHLVPFSLLFFLSNQTALSV